MKNLAPGCVIVLGILFSISFSHAQTTQPTTRPATAQPGFQTAESNDVEVPDDLRAFGLLSPFGDWLGLRSSLKNFGVSPALNLETDMAANPVGGQREGITEASNLGLDLLADLNKIAGIQNASFLVQCSERWGTSLSKEYIGNAFDTQQVFGGEVFRVVDLAYQQQLFDDRLELRIGRISGNDDFQVCQYDYFFMQNGFDGNPVGIYFNAPGMSAYPNATWGSMVKFKPTQRTYAMVGVYNGDPNVSDPNRHGVDFTMRGPVFVIGETGVQTNSLPDDKGPAGDYKAGAWYDGNTQEVFGSTETQRGSSGVYGLFDQIVAPFGPKELNRGLAVFGSGTFSMDPSVGQLPYFFTLGTVATGMFDCRPDDQCGLGFLYGRYSQDLRDAESDEQLVDPTAVVQDYEFVTELAYRFSLANRTMYFQPDLQFIDHPSGDKDIRDAFVVGCRVGINF
jgi:porin